MSDHDNTVDVKNPILENHSTLKLQFGRCTAWQIVNGNAKEYNNIFECSETGRNNSTYIGDKFAQSNFWRATTDRFWQYDDFAFAGIAAASYLIDAHRFKIWFNPTEFYNYLYMCVAYKDELAAPENIVNDKKKYNEYMEARHQEWEKIIDGSCKKYDEALNKYGFDRGMAQMLRICKKNKTWDFNAWIAWNNIITTVPYVAQNCESVWVHEMFHILWNHLARIEERDSIQFNLATDFSINQTINFTQEFAAGLITYHNVGFMKRFNLSTIKYLMQTDAEVAKSLKSDFKIDDKTDFNKITDKKITELRNTFMLDGSSWNRIDKFANKSADLYYRILLESCIFISSSGVGGYDPHGKWGEQSTDGDAVTQTKDDGKGGKVEVGGSNGTEKCKKANDGAGPEFHDDNNKQRGKGGREEHKGFDPMEIAASRREVKSAIKDSLERCGVNPDDPEEIEKALKATPGMDILGALILDWFKVRRKNWKQILKKELVSYSNPQDIDYTMSRESRVIEGFFPGKKRERGLDVIFQVDTSGSINLKDWNDFTNQISEISRSCDIKNTRCLQVHSVIASDEMVNISQIKNWRIKETGGTTMVLGPAKLKKEGNKKLLVIFTDGYIDVFFKRDYAFKIIIFLSRGNSHTSQTFIERGFQVINQDEE
jgi:predicted metal-dependent peptidase